MKIGILTNKTKYARGSSNFYPIIKWEKNLETDEGITFHYYDHHEKKEILSNDVVIIDSRYCRRLTVLEKKYENLDFIKEFIELLKRKNRKVLFFDNSDAAGGRMFELIEYVDVHVKKQIFRDKDRYTENRGGFSYRAFLDGYKLSEKAIKSNSKEVYNYEPCPKEHLGKIKLGWNIGMSDFRYFPLKRWYPISTDIIPNVLYSGPTFFNTDIQNKVLNSSFRGTVNLKNETYSFQRNKVITLFKKLNSDKFLTGEKVGKRKYLKELRDSKICVSPFGWGEVCYRDFEGIISGCILLKPDMGHIETYPDIYVENKTYISLKWSMEDLKEKLIKIIDNFDSYIEIIERAQKNYFHEINDYVEFKKRFLSLVD